MRRADREVTDKSEILDILHRTHTIRLGINGGEYPYVVPLSFGYESTGGQTLVYIHGAREGLKNSLLEKDNRVCVQADIFHRYTETEKGVTTEYESVTAFGTAEPVYGKEAARGLDLICTHCGFHGFAYDTAALERTRIYKITLSSVTGKRNLIPRQ
jgi:hypothetical protein